MGEQVNAIDQAIGAALRRLCEARRDDVAAAALKAGMTADELEAVMNGERRLRAAELFVISGRLQIPPQTLYADYNRSRSGCTHPH